MGRRWSENYDKKHNYLKERLRKKRVAESPWERLSDIEKVILSITPMNGIPLDMRKSILPRLVRYYTNDNTIEEASEDTKLSLPATRSLYTRINNAVTDKYGSLQYLKRLLSGEKR